MEYKIVDEDVECYTTIDGIENLTVTFFDAKGYKEEFALWVDEIKKHWDESTKDLHSQVSDYVKRTYNEDIGEYELENIFIDWEEKKMGTFGLMYYLENDPEDGLGVRFEDFEIKEIGLANISF